MIKTRLKERGSVSIMMALAVAGIGGLVALQMTMAYSKVHARQSAQKAQHNAGQSIQRLARLFKQAHMLHEMNSDCSSGSSQQHGQESGRRRQVIGDGQNAVGLCLPRSEELCFTNTEGGRTRRICASANAQALNWRRGAGEQDRVVIRQLRAPERRAREGVENRMMVPETSDSAVWKNCDAAGVSCVRIALCPEGQTTCSEREAVAFQVIRL